MTPYNKGYQEHFPAWPRAVFYCLELCWDLKWDWEERSPVGRGLSVSGGWLCKSRMRDPGCMSWLRHTFLVWFLVSYYISPDSPYPSKGGTWCFLTLQALVRKKVSWLVKGGRRRPGKQSREEDNEPAVEPLSSAKAAMLWARKVVHINIQGLSNTHLCPNPQWWPKAYRSRAPTLLGDGKTRSCVCKTRDFFLQSCACVCFHGACACDKPIKQTQVKYRLGKM